MVREVKEGGGSRPRTPYQSTEQLKTLRYEDAADGVPPVAVRSSRGARDGNTPGSVAAGQLRRPRTSPSPSPSPSFHSKQDGTVARPLPVSGPLADIKRDSAIAPSFSTATRTSYAESHASSTATGATKEPDLPTIVVHDGTTPGLQTQRSKSPLVQEWPKENLQRARSASPTDSRRRKGGVRAAETTLPSSLLDDLDLGDLASDQLQFSHRGSLIFAGRSLIQSPDAPNGATKTMDGMPEESPEDEQKQPTEKAGARESSKDEAPQKSGLKAGRRKPSIQMLQAAIQGGRLLSAEEMTFSMKVRSMYEYGDERAGQWTVGSLNGDHKLGNGTPDSPALSVDAAFAQDKSETPAKQHPALREPTAEMPAGYTRTDYEVAGGIEDWDEVKGEDVDRYGFINPGQGSSRTSTGSGVGISGLQRVATSLRVEAEQPRRKRGLRRRPSSSARSTRSAFQPGGSRGSATASGSVHSLQSTKSLTASSSGYHLGSRERRTVAEAADMLTLPPGLEDVREKEDAGRTASQIKRREWAREEKWQKMAKVVPTPLRVKGAGMQFTFDTTDSKVVNRTWKGIPDRWRAVAWHSFLSASAKKRQAAHSDEELVTIFHKLQTQSSADDVQIDMDVPRTIGMHIMFRRRYRGGQRLLFRVLHAMSLHFGEIGYVQGMGSVAATLLCYYDEERAFVMMVRLWQLRGLEDLYRAGFEGLLSTLREFEQHWLAGGDVAHRLDALSIAPTAYGTRWYLTLFNLSIPFAAQLRVWDVFMLLGDGPGGTTDMDVLHATSAALIDATRDVVLDSDFEGAMKVLTSFVPVRDEDLLMRVARAEWTLRKRRAKIS